MQKKLPYVVLQISRYIKDGTWEAGMVLPAQRALAASLGISRRTLQAALGQLLTAGTIERRAGHSGYFVPGMSVPKTPEIRRSFAASIEDQVWAWLIGQAGKTASPLTIKELCTRFGCSYRPMRAALIQLEKKDVVEHYGRKFRRKTGTGTYRGRRAFYFFGSSDTFAAYENNADFFIRHFESLLLANDLPPLHQLLAANADSIAFPPSSEIAAFVRFMFQNPKGIYRLEKKFPGVPRFYIDSTGNHLSSPKATRKNSTILYVDNRRAGEVAARHLATAGHRTLAFISHIGKQMRWVDDRAAGIGELFGHFDGCKGLVELYSPQNTDVTEKKVLHDSSAHLARFMVPVFESAFQQKKVTAWICSNDSLAATALHFLEEKSVAEPRKIALVGFDNSVISRVRDLTSCDLGFGYLAEAMLNLVLQPHQVLRDSRGHVPSIPRIMIRGSSR